MAVVEPGDKARMADLRNGEVINVVVVELHQDGKVIVEDDNGPKPRRRWMTDPSFLSPRKGH